MLLRRYGVVFRDVLERESTIPKWRELLPMLRRMEARGEVRGGHFLSGFGGEQFALPEALASLREARRSLPPLSASLQVAAADPLNLIGIVVPGERVAALPGKFVVFDRSSCGSAITSQDDEPAAQSPIFATASEQAAEVRR
jgi:ATP-dependent Lhr-like helicase